MWLFSYFILFHLLGAVLSNLIFNFYKPLFALLLLYVYLSIPKYPCQIMLFSPRPLEVMIVILKFLYLPIQDWLLFFRSWFQQFSIYFQGFCFSRFMPTIMPTVKQIEISASQFIFIFILPLLHFFAKLIILMLKYFPTVIQLVLRIVRTG